MGSLGARGRGTIGALFLLVLLVSAAGALAGSVPPARTCDPLPTTDGRPAAQHCTADFASDDVMPGAGSRPGDEGPRTIQAAGASSGTALPRTGRSIPFVAAGVAAGIALLLRAGRSKLDD